MKTLSCDTESMLYPVILKVKQGSLDLRRENVSKLGPIYRTKQDPVGEKQYETMLTIQSYGDWYSVYSHLDDNLSDWKSEFGDSYDVLLDTIIDSISYFPPSEKRTASKHLNYYHLLYDASDRVTPTMNKKSRLGFNGLTHLITI